MHKARSVNRNCLQGQPGCNGYVIKIVAASNYVGHVSDSPWCVYSCVSRCA